MKEELTDDEKEWNSLNFPSEYPDYKEREKIKSLAWKIINQSIDKKNYHKAAFFLLHGIIWAHYWRARETLEDFPKKKSKLRKIRGKNYYPSYVLDIDHYTCHWLAANGNLVPKEVIEAIKNDFYYEAEPNKYLPNGHTDYIGFE